MSNRHGTCPKLLSTFDDGLLKYVKTATSQFCVQMDGWMDGFSLLIIEKLFNPLCANAASCHPQAVNNKSL
ncbi:hypothetical protein T11_9416 [Trichinella zimbabwensis]|uniref:Uncharacterized protein n=1 Tax=Trichinella zimbabwensis TaxID=268475 RepID=A0A0V1I6T8_9BILA|nr:hypothetical protein T11_9416 [Trichinella zimbabwensis]